MPTTLPEALASTQDKWIRRVVNLLGSIVLTLLFVGLLRLSRGSWPDPEIGAIAFVVLYYVAHVMDRVLDTQHMIDALMRTFDEMSLSGGMRVVEVRRIAFGPNDRLLITTPNPLSAKSGAALVRTVADRLGVEPSRILTADSRMSFQVFDGAVVVRRPSPRAEEIADAVDRYLTVISEDSTDDARADAHARLRSAVHEFRKEINRKPSEPPPDRDHVP